MTESGYVRESEFKHRFNVRDFVNSCHQAFVLYGRGEIVNPPRKEWVEEREGLDCFRLDMPAEWSGRYRARKVIEEYSDVGEGHLAKRTAYIELEDLRKEVAVRLDAGFITDMRTGAAGALGIKYLAGAGVKRVGIVGTGRVAQSLALACDAVFELQELRCTSRKQENRASFAESVEPQLRAELFMAASVDECLCGVDVVLTAVPTPEPILAESDLAAIAHIAVMAGDGRTRQLAPEILERRQVVVDVLEQAQRSGEFCWACEQGREDRIALARGEDGAVLTIGDAACGRIGAERSVVYLTGMGAQDLCAAAMVYEALR